MKLTRAIALCALTLAIALAIGAVEPERQHASASQLAPIILIASPTPALPTPALPTPALVEPAAPVVEQPAALVEPQVEPAEISPAAPAAEVEQPAAEVEQLAPLEILHCPCNVLEAETPAPITDRDRAYSRARTR